MYSYVDKIKDVKIGEKVYNNLIDRAKKYQNFLNRKLMQ